MGSRWVLGVFLGSTLFFACAKPPTEKVNAAQAAFDAAKAAEASTYLADEFAKLDGALKAANEELQAQEQKGALSRNYGQTETLFGEVEATAAKLTSSVAAKKEEFKKAATESKTLAEQSLTQAKELFAKLPVSEDPAYTALKAELEGIEKDLAMQTEALSSGKFYVGAKQGPALVARLSTVSGTLKETLEKTAADTGKGKGKKKG